MLIGITVAVFGDAQEATPTPFGTTIEVKRIVTEVRVVNFNGSPVLGLGPEDFKVKVGGDQAEVEAVLWIPSAADALDRGVTEPGREMRLEDLQRPPEGRLVVILFQIDFGLQFSRTIGLVRMAPRASDFVSNLGPNDRIAVFVFGSHLELRADFTDDHQAISKMLNTQEVLRGREIPPDPAGPSFAEFLDPEEMKDAAMTKLTRVISSYYELSIFPPPDLDEDYTIKVSVDRRRTDVYVRQDHPSAFVW